jgi:hypothetical protein
MVKENKDDKERDPIYPIVAGIPCITEERDDG